MTSSIAYVNGQYVPLSDAAVHVEDRGYQFADGVYEVIAVMNGRLVDGQAHMLRLERSLDGLDIDAPCAFPVIDIILREVIRRNRLRNGSLYLQITRGVATRNHAYPDEGTRAALVITANRKCSPDNELQARGVPVITVAENRWARPDIKSVSLLPNVMAKQEAVKQGAFEAWFVDENKIVTEGSSSNGWIVDGAGRIITPPLNGDILAGITRERIMACAAEAQIEIIEEVFSVETALEAKEAFLSSTTACVMPIISIDGKTIGDGQPGPVTRRLMELYNDYLKKVSQGDD